MDSWIFHNHKLATVTATLQMNLNTPNVNIWWQRNSGMKLLDSIPNLKYLKNGILAMPLEWILFIVGLTILFFIIYTCPTWTHSYGNKNILLYYIVLYIHIPTSRLTLITKAYTMCINWRKTNKKSPQNYNTLSQKYTAYSIPFHLIA